MAINIKLPVNQSVDSQVDAPEDTTNKMDEPEKDNKTIEPTDDKPVDKIDSNQDIDKDDKPSDDTPASELVEIDGNEYTINDKGDALDKDGKVFMTKEEMDKLETPDDKDSDTAVSIEDIEKMSGIEVYDSEGKKLEFDLTVEGLAKREKAIKEQSIREGSNKVMDDFFKSNPDLYKAFIHKQKTGSLEGFTSQPFYKSMQLDKNNEQQLIQLVIEAEQKKGKTAEQAKRYAQYLKVENALDTEGEEAYKYLVAMEDKEFSSYEQTKQASKQQEIKSQLEFYGNYYDDSGKEVIVDKPGTIYNKIVTEGKFGNLAIPEDGININKDNKKVKLSRRDLFDYVARPVDQHGRTQAQIDLDNKLSNSDYLLQQYMANLTGNDLDVFLKRKVLENKRDGIKRRLNTGSKSTSSNNVVQNKNDKKLSVPVK